MPDEIKVANAEQLANARKSQEVARLEGYAIPTIRFVEGFAPPARPVRNPHAGCPLCKNCKHDCVVEGHND